MDFTLVQMWAQMGVVAKLVVVALAIMSVVTLGVAIERLFTYRKAQVQSRAFALAVESLLAKRQFQEASAAAEQFQGSHIAPVIRSGLKEYLIVPDIAAVKSAIERTTARQSATLRKGLAALATIGSTAPFVGLFGTTFGIINAFSGMALTGSGGIAAISAGIAEALITTAFGLFVAVPAVWAYNYFAGKVEGFNVEMDNSSSELLDYFIKKGA